MGQVAKSMCDSISVELQILIGLCKTDRYKYRAFLITRTWSGRTNYLINCWQLLGRGLALALGSIHPNVRLQISYLRDVAMALFANLSDTSTEREKPARSCSGTTELFLCWDEAESGPMRCQLKYLIREESIFVLLRPALKSRKTIPELPQHYH